MLVLGLFFLSTPAGADGQGSWFVYAQLEYPGNWDPYPDAFRHIYRYLTNTTSIRTMEERRVLSLDDKELFYSPFVIFTGRGGYPEFTEEQIVNLRRYIEGGGIILIDTCGDAEFAFCADRTIKRAFPRDEYRKIPSDHAIFRSFYLVDYVSGRVLNSPYLEAITVGSRAAVIKSTNDILGVWPRDQLGNWEYEIMPGKFGQRKEAIKLTLNMLIYSVCGTYKNDPVHEPYINQKLRR